MKKAKASALPTVLVISVLILILILVAFQLWNISAFYYSRYHFIKQQKFNISSAFTLYCNDSTFAEKIDNDEKFQLYEQDSRSTVFMKHQPWGLYECVSAHTFDRSQSSVRLVGKAQDTHRSLALWLCERDNSLSLSGEAEITGEAFLPKSGINYATLNSDSYRGNTIPSTCIHTSEKELPPIDSTYLQKLEEFRQISPALTDDIPPHYHSFSNELICAPVPEKSEELYAKGKLILYGDKVVIPSSWKLSDIIMVARHVTIEEGFSGSLQIMASDTVVIKKGAYLHYPSGIYLSGNNGKTSLHVCKDAQIEGYAVVKGDMNSGDGFIVDIHYRQDEGSILTGLLYVDGRAHLEGEISGCAYLKECYYLSGESMYAGMIYNGKIIRNNNAAFPFLFKESGYKRREIKRVE